jgi:cbb3-type cytochrome oxidase cytochrome c subunit
VAGEFVYDHPFQWGSKRTGPDLHRVGGKYSDEWHRIHLINPRDLVPESNMPAYPWLGSAVDPADDGTAHEGAAHGGRALHRRRDRQGGRDVKGKTEMDALIAYLQVLGTAGKCGQGARPWTSTTCAAPSRWSASCLHRHRAGLGLVAAAGAFDEAAQLPFREQDWRPCRRNSNE